MRQLKPFFLKSVEGRKGGLGFSYPVNKHKGVTEVLAFMEEVDLFVSHCKSVP